VKASSARVRISRNWRVRCWPTWAEFNRCANGPTLRRHGRADRLGSAGAPCERMEAYSCMPSWCLLAWPSSWRWWPGWSSIRLPHWEQLESTPWYTYAGGVLGVRSVTAVVILVPRLGVTGTIVGVVTRQLILRWCWTNSVSWWNPGRRTCTASWAALGYSFHCCSFRGVCSGDAYDLNLWRRPSG
jgi:hypothetical protein